MRSIQKMRAALPPGVIALGLLVLVVHGTLFWISSKPQERRLVGDESRYMRDALEIAAGGDWQPNPLWPILYPHFLAGVFAAGGGLVAVQVIQTLLLLGIAVLLGNLTCHLTSSSDAGWVAGGLVLVYPPLVAFAHYLWPEVLHLFLFLAALWILVRRSRQGVWLVAAGFLLGLAVLTKSLLWPFLPALLLPLALEGTWRLRAARVGLVVLGFTCVVSPVTRVYRPHGVSFVSSSVFNVWVGLNDRSRKNFVDPIVAKELKSFEQSAPDFRQRNRITMEKIQRFVEVRGVWEVFRAQLRRQPYRLFDKDSFLTDQLPGEEKARQLRGYAGPSPGLARALRWSSYVLYTAILLLAMVGMCVCPPRGRRWLWIILAFLVYNLVLFLVLHIKSRYRVPMLPFLFLYAGYAVVWLRERLRERLRQFSQGEEIRRWNILPRRWLAAALATGCLMVWAWGNTFISASTGDLGIDTLSAVKKKEVAR